MDKHSLDVLEFSAVQQKLGAYACTEPGKKLCQQICPKLEKKWIEEALSEVQQAREAILIKGRCPLSGLADIRPILYKADQPGSCLDIHELLEIFKFLDIMKDVIQWLSKTGDQYPPLKAYSNRLIPDKNLYEKLDACLDPAGEVKTTASPVLAKIRKQLRNEKEAIIHCLEKYMEKSGMDDALQGDFITIRNDRYVIPVKTKKRSIIQGIVHDESSSGATLFIEPMICVENQNRYRRLKIKEDEEIKRILYELSALVTGLSEVLKTNLDVLAEVDFLQAKALFSEAINGIAPIISSRPIVRLKRAKHPMLIFRYMDSHKMDDEPVPIDLELDQNTRAMVISGPNTGGKTVTLKMVGLLQLMMQSGLHITAEEGSELGIFKEVLADIGDEQDISKGLSSFSSHIQNMVRILGHVGPNSICLLDELGSDTNPSEGAALGIAVLEYIIKKDALCLITTHHNGLKAYASMHPLQVKNASMGFDAQRMAPTYTLHIGYPGSSNAFGICASLGLPSEILERAQDVLGEGEIKLDNLLYRLNQEEIQLRQEREKQEKLRTETELIKKRYNLLRASIEERDARIAKEAQSRIKIVAEKGRKEIERIVADFKRSTLTTRAIKTAHSAIKEVVQKHTPSSINRPGIRGLDIEKISIGQPVFISELKEQGIVRRIDRREKRVWVMVGPMKLQVKASDLAPCKSKNDHNATDSRMPFMTTCVSRDEISPKLMVIGRRVEDALGQIDKYIDDAVLAHLSQVCIIHGKGTGALQRAIEKFLLSHPHVISFRMGQPQEGGTGVTVVELAA